MAERQETQDTYRDGRAARRKGDKIDTCPFGSAELCLRGWWCAGWNDLDIELGAS